MNDKTRLLVMGALVVVLVVVMALEQQASKKRKARGAAQSTTASQQGESSVAGGQAVSGGAAVGGAGVLAALAKLGPRDEAMIQKQLERMKLDWGRNPFELASVGPTSKAGLLTLRGLSVTAAGRGFVIINESILREGDAVDGNQVVRIEPNQVVLMKDGREFIMKLEELER